MCDVGAKRDVGTGQVEPYVPIRSIPSLWTARWAERTGRCRILHDVTAIQRMALPQPDVGDVTLLLTTDDVMSHLCWSRGVTVCGSVREQHRSRSGTTEVDLLSAGTLHNQGGL